MCRLLGILSSKPIRPIKYVLEEKYSIVKQAELEKQEDGWGLCNFEEGHANLVVKSTKPVYFCIEEVKGLLSPIATRNFLFFVREASNPNNLEKSKILKIEATQPFVYKDIAFMHNGTIYVPNELKESLKDFELKTRSYNDSEPYFLAFLKNLRESTSVFEALKKTERLIEEVYERSKVDKPYAFSSLNVIISDGRKIYAYNRYNKHTKRSISNPDREFYKMCFLADKEKIIISSEPLSDEGWEDLGNGKFLEARIENGEIKFEIRY